MFHKTSIQRKQSADQDQDVQTESEPLGKTLAPPPFQLQASSVDEDLGEDLEKEASSAVQLKKAAGMMGFSPDLSPPSSDKFHSDAVPTSKKQGSGKM